MNDSALVDLVRQRLPDVQVLWLFGSHASGHATKESDVDLAVLLPRKLDAVARWEVQEALAADLHADVDLVDLHAASAVLRHQVIDSGRVLYEESRFLRDKFEMVALSQYVRLNEGRRGILEDVLQRGSVH